MWGQFGSDKKHQKPVLQHSSPIGGQDQQLEGEEVRLTRSVSGEHGQVKHLESSNGCWVRTTVTKWMVGMFEYQ
jgi:hypothetical protein